MTGGPGRGQLGWNLAIRPWSYNQDTDTGLIWADCNIVMYLQFP